MLKSVARVLLGYERRQQLRRVATRIRHFGLARHCPCYRASVRSFQTFGLIPRPEAKCPICGSLERHRLIYLYLRQKTDLFSARPKKMLHIAPEPKLAQLFRRVSSLDYLSADLFNPEAMVKMDITDIQYPDEAFDIIY